MSATNLTLPARDGTELRFTFVPAESTPHGILALVHGLGDYSGCFARMIDYFSNAGYHVAAIDLHGNGAAGGVRGDISDFNLFYDDIDLLLQQARAQFGDLPTVLYGHSLGGNLVLNESLRRKPNVAAVVASAPWLKLKSQPGFKWLAANLLNLFAPKYLLNAGIDTTNLTHDAEIVQEYIHDPLVHGQTSARLLAAAIRAGYWAQQHAGEFSLPLLIIHGGADSITDPRASEAFAKAVPNDLAVFKRWEGDYHTLHNETNREEIYRFVLQYLERVLSRD